MLLLVLRVCTVYIVQECEHIAIFYRTLNGYAVFQLNVCVCVCVRLSQNKHFEEFLSVSSTALSANSSTLVSPPLSDPSLSYFSMCK